MNISNLEKIIEVELDHKSRIEGGVRVVSVDDAKSIAVDIAKSSAAALKAVRALESANERRGETKFCTIYRVAAMLYAEEHLDISMDEACSRALTMWDVLVREFEKRGPAKGGEQ